MSEEMKIRRYTPHTKEECRIVAKGIIGLQQENQQLKEKVEWYEKENKHNQEIIIKDTKVLDEIREYINNHSIYFATKEKVGNYFANCSCDELLKILDKVN